MDAQLLSHADEAVTHFKWAVCFSVCSVCLSLGWFEDFQALYMLDQKLEEQILFLYDWIDIRISEFA